MSQCNLGQLLSTRNWREVTSIEGYMHNAHGFLESILKPSMPACLPDGRNRNFIIKPVKSSFLFDTGDSGTATMAIYPSNPVGQLINWWLYNHTDQQYEAPEIKNQAQVLSTNFDKARHVKTVVVVKSNVIAAGTYALAGTHMGVRFPYPAAEKPSSTSSATAYDKYSYSALVGVQSDPSSVRTSARMDESIVFIDFGQMGQGPIRLGDKIVATSTYPGGTETKVEGAEGTYNAIYKLDAQLATNATMTLNPDSTQYFDSGKILLTAVGGVTSTVDVAGKFTPTTPGPVPFKCGWYMKTFDLMGLEIDLMLVEAEVLWEGGVATQVPFNRSLNFTLPRANQLLSKPVVSQVQFGGFIQNKGVVPVTLETVNVNVSGNVIALGGSASGLGFPSYLWAVDKAPHQQFTVDVFQWFEATPNSDILQTTTTIPYPVGNVVEEQKFYLGLNELLDSGEFSYVMYGKEWDKIQDSDYAHATELLNWQPKFSEHFEQLGAGETAGAGRFFKGLGKKLSQIGGAAGKTALKMVLNEAKQVADTMAPGAVDTALETLKVIGASDPHVADLVTKVSKVVGTTAGGSLAGGSLSSGTRRRFVCAASIEENDLFLPQVYEVVSQPKPKPRFCFGVCAAKVSKVDPKEKLSLSDTFSFQWSKTSGIIVPCVMFDDSGAQTRIIASGAYYLFKDANLYKKLLKLGEHRWTMDSQGTPLIGHSDQKLVFTPILVEGLILLGVTDVETLDNGHDFIVKGDFNHPAQGPSVEAALCLERTLERTGMALRAPIALTGPMIRPESGGDWKFAEMPDLIGWWKAKAVHSLFNQDVPLFGNFARADYPVTTMSQLRKALGIRAVTSRGVTAGVDHSPHQEALVVDNMAKGFVHKHPGEMMIWTVFQYGVFYIEGGNCGSNVNQRGGRKIRTNGQSGMSEHAQLNTVSTRPRRQRTFVENEADSWNFVSTDLGSQLDNLRKEIRQLRQSLNANKRNDKVTREEVKVLASVEPVAKAKPVPPAKPDLEIVKAKMLAGPAVDQMYNPQLKMFHPGFLMWVFTKNPNWLTSIFRDPLRDVLNRIKLSLANTIDFEPSSENEPTEEQLAKAKSLLAENVASISKLQANWAAQGRLLPTPG